MNKNRTSSFINSSVIIIEQMEMEIFTDALENRIEIILEPIQTDPNRQNIFSALCLTDFLKNTLTSNIVHSMWKIEALSMIMRLKLDLIYALKADIDHDADNKEMYLAWARIRKYELRVAITESEEV